LWRSTDQGWVIKKYQKLSSSHGAPLNPLFKKMERIWHHSKPAKKRPATKTHRPGKEGINQRGNKETKDNPEAAAKLHSGDWSICP
jgi:hypothetical protein